MGGARACMHACKRLYCNPRIGKRERERLRERGNNVLEGGGGGEETDEEVGA